MLSALLIAVAVVASPTPAAAEHQTDTYLGSGAFVGDLDGDGRPDVVLTHVMPDQRRRLVAVRGDDPSRVLWDAPLEGNATDGLTMDLNGDGIVDLVGGHRVDEEPRCSTGNPGNLNDCRSVIAAATTTWTARDGSDGHVLWSQTIDEVRSHGEDKSRELSRRTTRDRNVGVEPIALGDVDGDGGVDVGFSELDISHISEDYPDGPQDQPASDDDDDDDGDGSRPISRRYAIATSRVSLLVGATGERFDEVVVDGEQQVVALFAASDQDLPSSAAAPDGTVVLTREGLAEHTQACRARPDEETQVCGMEIDAGVPPEVMLHRGGQVVARKTGVRPIGTADLDGDGRRDVVLQHVRDDPQAPTILTTLSGATSETLWTSGDLPSSARVTGIADLDGDGADDLVIGGGPLLRLDGRTGVVQPTADPSTADQSIGPSTIIQVIDDVDGDGGADIFLDSPREVEDFQHGHLAQSPDNEVVILSGSTGREVNRLSYLGASQDLLPSSDVDGDGIADARKVTYGGGPDGLTSPGRIEIVSLADGSTIWEATLFGASGVVDSVPSVDGGRGGDIVISAANLEVGEGSPGAEMTARDGGTGRLLWRIPPAAGQDPVADRASIQRLAAPDRIGTAAVVSAARFVRSDAVVIARADAWADAATGAPLAAALQAPMLLASTAGIPAVTMAEIRRLGAGTAIVLGGTAALGDGVVADLVAAGLAVERISGPDRFATSAAIAQRLHAIAPRTTVLLAEGSSTWVDAVLASSAAVRDGVPVLLTAAEEVPTATRLALDALAPQTAVAIGPGAANNIDLTRTLAEHGVPRMAVTGSTPQDLSVNVADFVARNGVRLTQAWVATDRRFPDALVAATSLDDQAVLLLVDGRPGTDHELAGSYVRAATGRFGRVVGIGGPAAVADQVLTDLAALARCGC